MSKRNIQPSDLPSSVASAGLSIEYLASTAIGTTATTADMGAALNTLIATVSAAGGGRILLPAWVTQQPMITSVPIVIRTGVILVGHGRLVSGIQLAPGANCALLQTYDYANQLSLGTGGGPYGWGLENLRLDGNNAHNTSGDVVDIYGQGFSIHMVDIINGAGLGINSTWSEGSGSQLYALPETSQEMEASLADVRVVACNGGGIAWNGPHDTKWRDMIVAYNGTSTVSPTTTGVLVNTFGLEATGVHVYGNQHKYAWDLGTAGGLHVLTDCQGEGAMTAQVRLTSNDTSILGGKYFNAGNFTTAYGIQLGDGTNYVADCRIDTRIYTCPSGAIYSYTEGNNNSFQLQVYQAAGTTVFVGTPPSTRGTVGLSVSGGATPGLTGTVVGASGAFIPAYANFVGMVGDIAGFAGVQRPGLGYEYLLLVPVGASATISKVVLPMAAIGTTLTAGACLVGVYNAASGALLGSSSVGQGLSSPAGTDLATVFTTAGNVGEVDCPLTLASGQSLSLTAGKFVYVAVLFNGTTSPQINASSGLSGGAANIGMTGSGLTRFAAIGSGRTTLYTSLPAIPPTQANVCMWAAVA
jgi:hypothetical protein